MVAGLHAVAIFLVGQVLTRKAMGLTWELWDIRAIDLGVHSVGRWRSWQGDQGAVQWAGHHRRFQSPWGKKKCHSVFREATLSSGRLRGMPHLVPHPSDLWTGLTATRQTLFPHCGRYNAPYILPGISRSNQILDETEHKIEKDNERHRLTSVIWEWIPIYTNN